MIGLNQCLKYLVDNGLYTYPPENVVMPTYEKLLETAAEFGNGWMPPSLELLESVQDEVELIQAKAYKNQHFKSLAKSELEATDWKITRHREQIDLQIATSLTNEQYSELLTERQAIRDKSNELEVQVNAAESIEQLNGINW